MTNRLWDEMSKTGTRIPTLVEIPRDRQMPGDENSLRCLGKNPRNDLSTVQWNFEFMCMSLKIFEVECRSEN